MWQDDDPASPSVVGVFPHAPGRFYDSRIASLQANVTLTTNRLYAAPFYVPQAHVYRSIGWEVTTQSAGNNARLGIYKDGGGTPGALVLDAGTIDLTGTGPRPIAITCYLPAGWYWLALVANGAAVGRGLSQTNSQPQLGFSSATDTTFHTGWFVAFTYGSLPDPFTGGGALLTTSTPRLVLLA